MLTSGRKVLTHLSHFLDALRNPLSFFDIFYGVYHTTHALKQSHVLQYKLSQLRHLLRISVVRDHVYLR